MNKRLGAILVISSIIYIIAVVIGGILKENYSHIYNSISELSLVGTKRIYIVEILFTIYNLLIIAYSVLTLINIKSLQKLEKIIISLIMICSISGLVSIIFPQEPRSAELSISGSMHLISTGVCLITTMLTTILTYVYYIKNKDTKLYAIYSSITFIMIFLFGVIGPIMIGTRIDAIFGLVERIAIGSFMIWLMITGLKQYKGQIFIKS